MLLPTKTELFQKSSSWVVEMMPKCVYGVDSRFNVFETDQWQNSKFKARIQQQIKSIACLVLDNHLRGAQLGPGVRTLSQAIASHPERFLRPLPVDRDNLQFGEGEKFRSEPCVGQGTAFLVGKQHVLTAAHCICSDTGELSKSAIAKMRVVFGFYKGSEAESQYPLEVYKVAEVTHYQYKKETMEDWALLKLDKPADGREPLMVDAFSAVLKDEKVYTLGHPSGLPLKVAINGVVRKTQEGQFEADLPIFTGNSGSPIFNEKTGQVIGIALRGNPDYVVDDDYEGSGQRRVRVNNSIGDNGYEKCQKLIFSKLRMALPSEAEVYNNYEGSNLRQEIRVVLRSVENTKHDLYAAAMRLNPETAQEYNYLGKSLPVQETVRLANGIVMTKQGLYLKAIALDQTFAEGYHNLGKLVSLQGIIRLLNGTKLTKQQLHLQAITLDPALAEAYYHLAETLPARGSIRLPGEKAVTARRGLYLKAIDLDSKYFEAYKGLGNLLAAREAVMIGGVQMTKQDLYCKAIELNPACVEAYHNLADLVESVGDIAGETTIKMTRQQLYLKVIALDPSAARAYYKLGTTLSSWFSSNNTIQLPNGQHITEQGCYLKAIELNPRLSEAYYDLGASFSFWQSSITLYSGKEMTQSELLKMR